MAQNDKPVIVTLSCEAYPSTATEEIDRAEWDARTPAQRLALIEDMADTHMTNSGGYGWAINDPDDEAAVASTVPEPLRELAEWLVSLDGHPLMVDRPTPGDMRAIISRAREALGRPEEG